jgi:hypothetical protein
MAGLWDGGDTECIPNFGVETSRKTSTLNIEKEMRG